MNTNTTVRRLESLVRQDRLIAKIDEMPYSFAWVRACAELWRLSLRHEAA